VHKAALFVNIHKENASTVAEEIRIELEKQGTDVTVFVLEGLSFISLNGTFDIAFTLGGDGTVLYVARLLAAEETPILPVHLGTLGFLAGVQEDQWLSVYRQWQNGTARISLRCMLDLAVERGGQVVFTSACLNDAVISSQGIAKLIRLRAEAETAPGELADLGHYRSDGLIMATPTGSTAYSMAAGGPILDPEMEAVIVSPVCPFTLSNRPLVLPSRQTLIVTVEMEQRSGVLLTIDGQNTFELKPGDKITIKHSPHYARLITAGQSAYYSALKEKLAWGGDDKGNSTKNTPGRIGNA
jgi:NAD+ kinase